MQSIEQFIHSCRNKVLSGFYEGQWILTDADHWYEYGTESASNSNLGPDFQMRGNSNGKAEFAIEFDKVIQDTMADSIIE